MIIKPTADTRWATMLTNAGATGNPNKLEPTAEFKNYGQPEEEPTDRQSINYVLDANHLWRLWTEQSVDRLQLTSSALSESTFKAQAANRRRSNAGSGFLEKGKVWVDSDRYDYSTDGMWNTTAISYQETLRIGRSPLPNSTGTSSTGEAIALIDGMKIRLIGDPFEKSYNVSGFPEAPDGTETFNTSTGQYVKHLDSTAAFSSETSDNKVILSRKDLVLIEVWKEALEDKGQVCYLGNVQQNMSNPYGIPETIRSDAYTRLGEWDTNTVGLYSDWNSLTDSQKLVFTKDSDNNIYYDSVTDKFIQVCYRARVIKGFGSVWDYTDNPSALRFSPTLNAVLGYKPNISVTKSVRARGSSTSLSDFTTDGLEMYYHGGNSNYSLSEESKTFSVGDSFTNSYDGKCHCIPVALVSRFNSGIYHPTYNLLGTRLAADSLPWYSTNVSFSSTQDCFDTSKLNISSGTTASTLTGRSDHFKYYNAIYLGMTEDIRINSRKINMDQLLRDAMFLSIKGRLRGRTKLIYTKVFNSVGAVTPEYTIINQDNPSAVVAESDSVLPTEYDYVPWVDLIGDPVNILATFPDGVVGKWIPEIPNGTLQPYTLSKKGIFTYVTGIFTNNNGSSWNTHDPVTDVYNNVFYHTYPSTRVELVYYSTYSEFTEPQDNTVISVENKEVLTSSIDDLHKGNRLGISLVDVIGKSNEAPYIHKLSPRKVDYDGSKIFNTEHDFVDLSSINNTSGYKTTASIVEKDRLLFVQFHTKELKYSTGSFSPWGDNGVIEAVDGNTTVTDNNGNTVKVTCHHTILPIGVSDRSVINHHTNLPLDKSEG